ncbi:LysM peptidoglycan-binding domain-containing protein [Alkalilimnicola sp. S0819]|uniref:LysM peptidoglycan-binding domain-containing protein n=1 Tax=Alkalilimnicola sp. S0819 TaxID=2613922 RepID=UPI0012617C27|nr:LysM domain-containing protein [Alkalilimnicola sp. S0819]KAB7627241.1 LysM peptidoglycan-binding domain-containing protein [Alkalilimnicola sp. S0819]MPQ15954.1 LysM peptidoglycan-binding domain-containing protein [Alkalilimnicola sp. S0819]
MRKLAWLLVTFLVCAPLMAAQDAFRSDRPERYEVQRGDTLWDISGRFLNEPWFWPEIWYKNPQIENPHLIYPGDIIRLLRVDGEPRLTVERGQRTVKLSPRAREIPLDQAIHTIPLDAIRPFLTRTSVVSEGELEAAPYILAGADERVMGAPRDTVYVRGFEPVDQVRGYAIVRKGDPYTDPETGELLGHEAIHIGQAVLLKEGDPASFRITEVTREVLPGDRLLRLPEDPLKSRYVPTAPAHEVEGVIMAVLDGVTQIGQYSVVALNRGAEHGLAQGHVLDVLIAGRQVRDTYAGRRAEMVTLPREPGGQLIVFRVFERMSLGLIMEAERAMNVGDAVQTP